MPRAPFDPATDYYALLNVPPYATPAEIRAAYRQLAKACHPDLHAGAAREAARMARLNAAKSVLLDPSTRSAYDASRRARHAVVAVAGGPVPPRPRPARTAPPSPPPAAPAAAGSARPRWLDPQTAAAFALVFLLGCAVLFYVVEAVQVAARPARTPPADLALAPVTRPDAQAAARAAYSIVKGQPPTRRVGLYVYQLTQGLVDSSPEAEVLRSIGRRLYRAGVEGDAGAWAKAVTDLCALAGQC
jgi:curved DNA-binding protein CbpA